MPGLVTGGSIEDDRRAARVLGKTPFEWTQNLNEYKSAHRIDRVAKALVVALLREDRPAPEVAYYPALSADSTRSAAFTMRETLVRELGLNVAGIKRFADARRGLESAPEVGVDLGAHVKASRRLQTLIQEDRADAARAVDQPVALVRAGTG